MAGRHALVIGGTRFFGRRLVRQLLDEGFEVDVLSRGTVAPPDERARHLKADRRDRSAFRAAIGTARWDVVFDQVCFDASDAQGLVELLGPRAERFVVTSSQSVYGPGAALPESAFDAEAHAFSENVDAKSNYAEAKRQCEAVIARSEISERVAFARFPFVLGNDDYTGRLDFHVKRVLDGEPIYLPAPRARLALIEASDAARSLIDLARGAAVGPYNLCSPEPLALVALLSLIEERVGRSAKLEFEPNDESWSPYGVDDDWYMNPARALALGLTLRTHAEWLDGLVDDRVRSLSTPPPKGDK